MKILYPTRFPFITQHYGNKGENFGPKGHRGVDFRIKNDPQRYIQAVQSGKVITADSSTNFNWYNGDNHGKGSPYGKFVIIEHAGEDGRNYFSFYGHLREILVEEGTEVAAGQLIAIGGNTGLSTAEHLHFELRMDENSAENSINPLPLFTKELTSSEINQLEIPIWADKAVKWVESNELFRIVTEEDIRDAVKFHRLYLLLNKK